MACSSSSSLALVKKKYEVFVSFRGEDTRNSFTSFLLEALSTKCITTFRDDKELEGQPIAPGLFHAIEESRVYIVVFSKNYASSTWCLQELAKIHYECPDISSGKHVLPIFYDVDPSEVRKQSGDYGEAIAKHEERFKDDLEKMAEVQTWRQALTHVANCSGWDIRNKSHSGEMKKIVEKVVNILAYECSSPPHDLVGIQSPLQELEELLRLDLIDDVRVIGICGMGGIGKTTLANALFHKISRQFNACCFIKDVSKSHKDHGPIAAQKQILHRTLNIENLQIWDHYHASNLIRRRLHLSRALIVLDNVDQDKQLQELALNREWLGVGSRIIIISRNEHILEEHGVDKVYKVPLLNPDNSLQLFCTKAFKLRGVLTDYEKLTYDILAYANGLPLAIKVLGSFLSGRNISEWKSALARLRKNPDKDIMDVLRLSFDGLEGEEKEIFLDIACFFYGCELNYVKKVLNCCGFHVDIGLSVLVEKSLISIKTYIGLVCESFIEMHGLLQELGRKIVQESGAGYGATNISIMLCWRIWRRTLK